MRRTHFPQTTPSQRHLLFKTWETTGNVEEACRVAHVGRRTFYYWKRRFHQGGYAALAAFASRAPHHLTRVAPAVEQRVIALRQEHPDWGQQRLADALAKANGWVPLVSPNTVTRILRDAGLWVQTAAPDKKGGPVA